MSHPFDLELCDLESIELDFGEELTNEEAAKVVGGRKQPKEHKDKDKVSTTLAVGEEGGEFTTLALGEEGGNLY